MSYAELIAGIGAGAMGWTDVANVQNETVSAAGGRNVGAGDLAGQFADLQLLDTVWEPVTGAAEAGERCEVSRKSPGAQGCSAIQRPAGVGLFYAPTMVPEAPLQPVDGGLAPAGEGWFVLNALEARWLEGDFGAYTRFEGESRFPHVGINVGVLSPGQPACMYHGEGDQEGFLVLSGECLLLVEGEERHLKTWDFFHCPAWTEHVFVGAGDGPCAILAVGARTGAGVVYPASEVAQRHGAGVAQETSDPDEAYKEAAPDTPVGYREGWLPA